VATPQRKVKGAWIEEKHVPFPHIHFRHIKSCRDRSTRANASHLGDKNEDWHDGAPEHHEAHHEILLRRIQGTTKAPGALRTR
jgi:hypothetical protein